MMNQKLIDRIIDRYIERTGTDYDFSLRSILETELNWISLCYNFIEQIKSAYYVLPEQPTVCKDKLKDIIDSFNKYCVKQPNF